MSNKVNICGEWYYGDSFKVTLTKAMLPATDLVNKIERKVQSLRSLYYEFVVVDLQNCDNADSEYPLYYQTARNRDYKKTDTYLVELGMQAEHGTVLYIKDGLALGDALDLFRKICVNREKPNKDEWRVSKHVYSGKNKKDVSHLKHYKNLLSAYWQNALSGKGLDYLEFEALQHIVENDGDPYYKEILARKYDEYGFYEKLNTIFKTNSYHPIVAEIKGEIELRGKLGKPDYRKAFEYFTHAMNIGSLLAEYNLAMMYKHGLYVKQNYETYEKMLRSVYGKYESDNRLDCCPDCIILELSKLARQNGNEERALSYCLKALKNEKFLMSAGCCNITDNTEAIVRQVHDLGYFDPDEMNLLDLLCVLKKPCGVSIKINREVFAVYSYYNNGQLIVRCGEKYYRNAIEFLKRHKINGRSITDYINEINYMEIM